MSEITDFYRLLSPTSDPGRHTELVLGFPANAEALGAIVRGLLIHNFAAKVRGLPLPAERMSHMQAVGAEVIHWVVEYWDGNGWRLTDPQLGRSDLTGDDFRDGLAAWQQCRAGASVPAWHGNGELWGWDELRGSLINDVAALNKVEVSGWYWCDRIKVDPLDQPNDELDASLDTLCRRAASVTSVEALQECCDLYPELQPPADAVAC